MLNVIARVREAQLDAAMQVYNASWSVKLRRYGNGHELGELRGLSPLSTVQMVKLLLQQTEGFPMEHQRLVAFVPHGSMRPVFMEDRMPLAAYDVRDCGNIYLALPPGRPGRVWDRQPPATLLPPLPPADWPPVLLLYALRVYAVWNNTAIEE